MKVLEGNWPTRRFFRAWSGLERRKYDSKEKAEEEVDAATAKKDTDEVDSVAKKKTGEESAVSVATKAEEAAEKKAMEGSAKHSEE